METKNTRSDVSSDAESTSWSTTTPAQRRRSDLVLLTLFWTYATMTNVVWGVGMQQSLASTGIFHIFASWQSRLIQHLLLYPMLLGTLWLSRRIGWQPIARALPLQALCAFAFSLLGNPTMDLAQATMGDYPWHEMRFPGFPHPGEDYPGQEEFLWVASSVMFLINYAFCLALLTGFGFYRRYRDSQLQTQALERSLSASHLATLRMQLSPHTLFNLLHTIRCQVRWDPEIAQSMILQLGDLLHRTLRAGEHELSRLQDELEFVRLYLQLQQRRFADRLSISLPDSDAAPAVWVPSLILQPLVENAVVHSLAQPRSAVTVRLEVAVDQETLILRVVNSMPTVAVATDSVHPGIGLKNVRERLAIQFAGRASCEAGPSFQHGWLAELRLPMLHAGT